MLAARSLLLFALLPLFTGCQMLASQSATPTVSKASMIRMQGELSGEGGKLLFQPCNEQRRFVVDDIGNTGVLQEGANLANTRNKLFADLRGTFTASKAAGSDGQLGLYQLYRVQRAGQECDDPNFKRLTLHVNGNSPKWTINVSNKGMVLERQGKEALGLPYLEEQLPEGRFSVSSDANDQHIELWVAPQRCVDSVDGSVQHLSAELRINSQVFRGCGYYGGMRND